ncbi:hypothetical protein HHK36_014223 [Tetracentron sinense]|uniref:CCHC-type domain-containing protein n=1 Tax=Tetracentron sinense TaxID=13715 RepID=A0A834Z7S8_TETSI|nr:hypothetical protein HHK36_014223 [Tetracentron sinense]
MQNILNQLSAMKMSLEEELKTLLLLSCMPDNWENLVAAVSNAEPEGGLTFAYVTDRLLNEEIRRKSNPTEFLKSKALAMEERGRSVNRSHQGRDKSKGRSKSRRGKIKCYHCEKLGHMKKECRIIKREQSGKESERHKDSTDVVSNGDDVILVGETLEECLLTSSTLEWIVDCGASYHATSCRENFISYNSRIYGIIRMGNQSTSNIIGMVHGPLSSHTYERERERERERYMKDRILIIGATGYLGRRLVKTSLALGIPTYCLYRPEVASDVEKVQMLIGFKLQGAHLLKGSFEDHESLVSALKQVDVVISAVAGNHIKNAILEQLKLIQAIKEVGTIKVENFMPPTDHVVIYGKGGKKCIWNDEDDMAMYTMLAVDDPRTLNKTLYIRPPVNLMTQT